MNRLEKYFREDADKGGRQMDAEFKIEDLQEQLKLSSGYMLGVTFLNKGMLATHFITNNFPTGDIDKSLKELGRLAEAALKTSENVNEPKK